MSTHNICFCREIRKILCGYPLLSVAMSEVLSLVVKATNCVIHSCLFTILVPQTGLHDNLQLAVQ